MIDERTRVAFHEAGHAVMAWILGHEIDVVSIAPTRSWAGVCFSGPGKLGTGDLEKIRPVRAPLAMQPPELRSNLEGRILVALAGRLAEELYLFDQRASRYVLTADEKSVEQTVRDVALTPDQRELLARGDQHEPEPPGRDERSARENAELLVAEEEVFAYVAWLRASARRIVHDPDFVRLVEALVDALLEHESVPGDAVVRILNTQQRSPK